MTTVAAMTMTTTTLAVTVVAAMMVAVKVVAAMMAAVTVAVATEASTERRARVDSNSGTGLTPHLTHTPPMKKTLSLALFRALYSAEGG